jgi:hypothetical protein
MTQLLYRDRLDTILSHIADARGEEADASGGRVRRLSRVLEAISAFRKSFADPEPPKEREFAAERLGEFLGHLGAGLASCRKDGRLLNVWTIAGLKRNEVRISAVLGWALDCNGSHGFHAAILEGLIELLRQRGHADVLNDVVLGRNYRVSVEHCPLGERDNRVDLAVEGENCVIFIEVKIDAPEGPKQLSRYLQTARARALSLNKPISLVLYVSETWPPTRPYELICLTWRDIAQAMSKVVRQEPNRTMTGALLLQFVNHLKNLH